MSLLDGDGFGAKGIAVQEHSSGGWGMHVSLDLAADKAVERGWPGGPNHDPCRPSHGPGSAGELDLVPDGLLGGLDNQRQGKGNRRYPLRRADKGHEAQRLPALPQLSHSGPLVFDR